MRIGYTEMVIENIIKSLALPKNDTSPSSASTQSSPNARPPSSPNAFVGDLKNSSQLIQSPSIYYRKTRKHQLC